MDGIVSLLWFIVGTSFFFSLFRSGRDQNKQKKEEQQEKDELFIKENNVTISAEYRFENFEYTANGNQDQSIMYRYIVDDIKKNIYIIDKNGKIREFAFDKVSGCEILIDSEVIGGVGRSVVGGILAGSTGAVVGALTAKKQVTSFVVVVYLAEIAQPMIELTLINKTAYTNGYNYSNAQSFAVNVDASIRAIINEKLSEKNDVVQDGATKFSARLKVLDDAKNSGLLTDKEYAEKRAEIISRL